MPASNPLSATVYPPMADAASVTEEGKTLAAEKEIGSGAIENGYIVLQLGSRRQP